MEDKKNLEVVSDDGSSLNISPVYDHLNIGKPKSAEERPKNIVIPKTKEKEKEKDEDDKDNKVEKKVKSE